MIAPRNTPAPTRPRAEVDEIAAVVDAVRVATPLTQCLTNSVVTGFTANVLLAVGASPAMVDSLEEGPIFAGIADGLLINVGTVDAATVEAMLATAASRAAAGRSWCLDPVAVGTLPVRTKLARDLLEYRPDAVRGNASEVLGLFGETGAGRGVDAPDLVALARAVGPEGSVVTLEYEPAHAKVAQQNLDRAGVADRVEIVVGAALDSLPGLADRAPFDLVFANILKQPLIDLVPDMARYVGPGGYAILSGILATQADEVVAAYAAGGLALDRREDHGEWTTLVVRRG